MTEKAGKGSKGRAGPRAKWPHEWQWFQSLGALAAVAGVIIAAVTLYLNVFSWHNTATPDPLLSAGPSNSSSNTAPTIQQSRTTISTPSPNPTQNAVGQCLSTDTRVVPCDFTHRFEVVAAPTTKCSQGDITEYLGGDPDVDVIFVIAKPMRVSNSSVCAIANHSGTDRPGSVRNVLQAAPGSDWRRCFDSRGRRHDVPCDLPHTGEYVGMPAATAPNLRSCESAAEVYLATTLDQVPELKISPLPVMGPTDSRPRCLLSVRGANLLTASVRSLGPNALPLEPPN